MLDPDTEIRHPHSADDPRVSVATQEEGATLTLFFDPATAWAGDAPLLEIRLTPTAVGELKPWLLSPRLLHHLQLARARLARSSGDITAAIQALRAVNAPRRGLNDDFLRAVAQQHETLVAEGEPYPVKTIADMQAVDISTASRWITTARRRGLLEHK
jgi:hypothetical protein